MLKNVSIQRSIIVIFRINIHFGKEIKVFKVLAGRSNYLKMANNTPNYNVVLQKQNTDERNKNKIESAIVLAPLINYAA